MVTPPEPYANNPHLGNLGFPPPKCCLNAFPFSGHPHRLPQVLQASATKRAPRHTRKTVLRTAPLATPHCGFCFALLISYSTSPSFLISITCCQASDCKSNMSMARDVLSWGFKSNDIVLTHVKRRCHSPKHIENCPRVLPGWHSSPSSGRCTKMPTLNTFFSVSPGCFLARSWQ